jgi:hypothetical protein
MFGDGSLFRKVIRIMIRNIWLCAALIALQGFGSAIRAGEMQQMSSESSQRYGQHLSELFEKENRERQVKFEVDPTQATGLHEDQDGILVVPIKGLKEEVIDPAVVSENGGGLCYLFLSPCYTPVVDGKPIDGKKLRRVKFKNGQGDDREAICLVVTVKHVGGDDWRLFAFGAEKTPVIDSRISESQENVDRTLAIQVGGAKDNKANLALTLYKKVFCLVRHRTEVATAYSPLARRSAIAINQARNGPGGPAVPRQGGRVPTTSGQESALSACPLSFDVPMLRNASRSRM